AGSFVLLLLWIYYSSQVFFLGAEFTKAWADLRGAPPQPDTDAIVADQRMPSGRVRASDQEFRHRS
ncbi:MAG TPA: YihY/virulence factor BrkB family protein, partial [Planctomycetota bacterium]|nr:YihY/virulence factor BrkB family protein [Planctomycetota bacterium]